MTKRSKDKGGKIHVQDISRQIMSVFHRFGKRQMNYKQIAKAINANDEATKQVVSALLIELVQQGKLEQLNKGKYRLKEKRMTTVGTVDLIRSGSAFIATEQYDEDVFRPIFAHPRSPEPSAEK